jgi:glycosyltransferase involved in cell wall biosynthesis
MTEVYDICAAVVSDLRFDARVWKEVRSLAAADRRVALIGCAYELVEPRRRFADGVDILEIPLGSRAGHPSTVKRGVTLLQVWKAVLTTRARAYHAHNVHVLPAAFVASRLRGASLVYDAHELYGESVDRSLVGRLSGWIAGAVERFAARFSDAVITTNASRADALQERYGISRPIVLGNVPARIDDVVPLDPGYPKGRPVLLYQGGIYARGRAFRETIEAVATLDVEFVIIGFGREDDLRLIREWADELGVSERVHLLPPRPFDELVRTAAAASVGIVPVTAHRLNEALGDTNKLFEYLMAGLPVVASDLPEMRAVVQAGDPPVGELFDPHSSTSIAAAIQRVLEDPAVYERRRDEARRLAREQFNWSLEEPRLLGLYESLLPHAAGAGAPA